MGEKEVQEEGSWPEMRCCRWPDCGVMGNYLYHNLERYLSDLSGDFYCQRHIKMIRIIHAVTVINLLNEEDMLRKRHVKQGRPNRANHDRKNSSDPAGRLARGS